MCGAAGQSVARRRVNPPHLYVKLHNGDTVTALWRSIRLRVTFTVEVSHQEINQNLMGRGAAWT